VSGPRKLLANGVKPWSVGVYAPTLYPTDSRVHILSVLYCPFLTGSPVSPWWRSLENDTRRHFPL
jgi:hypothetical protein